MFVRGRSGILKLSSSFSHPSGLFLKHFYFLMQDADHKHSVMNKSLVQLLS